MVKKWNEGTVETDGVDFTIIEEIISHVTGISIAGTNFYRDRKISGQAVMEFTKNLEEKKRLAKHGTHYLPRSIKPIWRFVLTAIIKYIMLDTRFDHICNYHFILLNHF